MAKPRKKPGSRQPEKKLLIFCEGAKDKSESAYFKALIKDRYNFRGNKIEVVKVIDTDINTGKQLVAFAKNMREMQTDELWIVYDKDGYTKHAETFNYAKSNNIKIAFSSISFEYWILLHFQKTSKPFSKSDDIIHDLKHSCNYDYEKTSKSVYQDTKNELPVAIDRAAWIQKYQLQSNAHNKIFNFNPYTDIDKLIKAIDSFLEK